jgi:hypothetical protein
MALRTSGKLSALSPLVGVACMALASPAWADPGDVPWASSSGNTGAGLGLESPQSGLFWGEGAFHTQDGLTSFSPLFGAGFFVTDDVELEVMLPLAWANVEFDGNDESALRVGAPYFGVNYVHSDGRMRFKIGGGIAWNPFSVDSGAAGVALLAASAMRGMWDPWLWSAQTLNLAAPFRLELDLTDSVVFGIDAGFDLAIPTHDGDDDVDLVIEGAPGFGFRLSDEWLFGLRLAGVFIPTADGENEQFSFEPYVRGAFGSGFFLARVTLNLDEPYGFSFEEDEIWGLHAGGGFAW